MCGICGGFAFTERGRKLLDRLPAAVQTLSRRGPDGTGSYTENDLALGHTRLAVIDTSAAAAQPFTDNNGRHVIIFNGEIFNYRELRAELEAAGETFRTHSDTEVLLRLYIREGEKGLHKLNGFFAFAVWNKETRELFLARDRYGEKPLYVHHSDDVFLFASEMKALIALGIPRKLDREAVMAYLHLNYIPPGSWSVFYNSVHQLWPGHSMRQVVEEHPKNYSDAWYKLPETRAQLTEEKATAQLAQLVENAVQRRLVADVPLGSFLSGGVDSSVIAALAAKHVSKLQTFSIGFTDEPQFDETQYARQVAKHIGAEHTVFALTNNDLYDHLFETLDYIDEPFADSSALAVSILSKHVRKHVTVALSGDGADELFAGYNKHRAEFLARDGGLKNRLVSAGSPLWNMLPASRNSRTGNRIRQLRRFAEGLALSPAERYWRWAGYTKDDEALRLLVQDENDDLKLKPGLGHWAKLLTDHLGKNGNDLNDVLLADLKMVLPGDMLVKVDRMSMCHGLEVRSPFLDHEVVEFALSLPASYKIDARTQKKILKQAFGNVLPAGIFQRRKQGFEVPLLKWFRGELRGLIEELLNEKFLKAQGIFDPAEVKKILAQLRSNSPGDATARVWGLIVFQYWWKKYMG